MIIDHGVLKCDCGAETKLVSWDARHIIPVNDSNFKLENSSIFTIKFCYTVNDYVISCNKCGDSSSYLDIIEIL